MSWPNRINKGRVEKEIFASYDLFPTICDLVNVDFPDNLDGLSMKPTILAHGKQNSHDYLYWEFPAYGGQQALRMGKWKAIRKNIFKGNKHIELYNLDNDIRETNDVSNLNYKLIKKIDSIFKEEHSESSIERFKLGYIDKVQ